MTTAVTSTAQAELTPVVAWRQRVFKVGGYIQLAFAVFWLVRSSLTIHGTAGTVEVDASVVLVVGVGVYAVSASREVGRPPPNSEAKRIESSDR